MCVLHIVSFAQYDACQFLKQGGFDYFVSREEKGTSVYRGEGIFIYVGPSLPPIGELIIYSLILKFSINEATFYTMTGWMTAKHSSRWMVVWTKQFTQKVFPQGGARRLFVAYLAPLEQYQLLPLPGHDLQQDISVGRHLRHAQPIMIAWCLLLS